MPNARLLPCLLLLLPAATLAQSVAETALAPALEPAPAPALEPALAPALEPAPPPEPAPVPPGGKPVNRLDEVEVTAPKLDDTEQRRYSTAARMVFGREELDRFGDSSLGDVLKRLPGVTLSGTPGRGGDIRMRGLGSGYTMILLNGEPMPRGFSLDQLTPEQVERIEISRAPVVEHSTRAIAGTINIVLRESIARHNDLVRPALSYEAGRFQPQLFLQHEDGSGRLQYSMGAHVHHQDDAGDTTTLTRGVDNHSGATLLAQSQRDQTHSIGDGLHLNGRLLWKLGGGDSLSLQPFLMDLRSNSYTHSSLDQSAGSTPAPFATADASGDSRTQVARLMGNLKLGLAHAARLELRCNLGQSVSDNSTTRDEYDSAGKPSHVVFNRADISDRSYLTAGKYSRPVGSGHQLAAGWEVEGGERSEAADTLQDGLNPLASYGDRIHARTLRLAGYAQDEWDISPLWSVYGGARWEQIQTRSSALAISADNTGSVLDPVLHSVWRFSAESRDQIRAAFTESYRAPTLSNLAPIPTLSGIYPASVANTAASPDSEGNPALRPELARGLDLAYEHYLAQGGLLSASAFARDISDLIRNVVSLEPVAWSNQARWVSRPQNFAHATTRGIELEAKFQPAELVAGASRNLDLRLNYSRYWSSVDGVPGPDNRLDQQPHQTANLGSDYRWPGLPLTLGGNISWTPGFVIQKTSNQTYLQGSKRVLDLYGLWKFDPRTQLRIALSNALHYDYLTGDGQSTASFVQNAQTIEKTYPSITARLELRL
ncbi:MAG: TonB-dependent receptor [Pseudomonadota bacterium]|nr:TonB-dependent receptor [Pseudomonadota bacterium]